MTTWEYYVITLNKCISGWLGGMTTNGYCKKARFRHSDKAPGRNLDALASWLSSANGEPFNGQPVPLLFPTPYPLPLTPVSPKPRSRNKFGMTR